VITVASLADCGGSSVEFQVTLNTVELPKNWSLFNLNALLASSPGASSGSQPFTVGSQLLNLFCDQDGEVAQRMSWDFEVGSY